MENASYCGAPCCNIYEVCDESNVFSARLRVQLKAQRLSRKRLAEKTGVSLSTVGRWLAEGLKGGEVPLFRIAQALNISSMYLVGLRDSPDRPVYPSEEGRDMLRLFEALSTTEKRALIAMIQESHAVIQKERC